MAVDHDAGHKNKKKMPGVVSKGGKHRGGFQKLENENSFLEYQGLREII